MSNQRRDFLKQVSFAGGGLLLCDPLNAINYSKGFYGKFNNILNEVSIYHTNDLHNRIEAVEFGKNEGYGGLRNIEKCIEKTIGAKLLLDAGDFLDETKSTQEHLEMVRYMNQVGYTAATIGNREIARGEEYLAQLMSSMNFSLVNCNYQFQHPILKEKILSYKIHKTGRFRIGITGIGLKSGNDSSILWEHPYDKANEVAGKLKRVNGCDLVICLSHLGYEQSGGEPSSKEFLQFSENIDLVIGGHGDYKTPYLRVGKNKHQEEVLLSHAFQGGITLNKLSFTLNAAGKKRGISYDNIVPGLVNQGETHLLMNEFLA